MNGQLAQQRRHRWLLLGMVLDGRTLKPDRVYMISKFRHRW